MCHSKKIEYASEDHSRVLMESKLVSDYCFSLSQEIEEKTAELARASAELVELRERLYLRNSPVKPGMILVPKANDSRMLVTAVQQHKVRKDDLSGLPPYQVRYRRIKQTGGLYSGDRIIYEPEFILSRYHIFVPGVSIDHKVVIVDGKPVIKLVHDFVSDTDKVVIMVGDGSWVEFVGATYDYMSRLEYVEAYPSVRTKPIDQFVDADEKE